MQQPEWPPLVSADSRRPNRILIIREQQLRPRVVAFRCGQKRHRLPERKTNGVGRLADLAWRYSELPKYRLVWCPKWPRSRRRVAMQLLSVPGDLARGTDRASFKGSGFTEPRSAIVERGGEVECGVEHV